MKKLVPILSLIVIALFGVAAAIQQDALSIGDTAPLTDAEMKDVSGEMITLKSVSGPNGLLVMFSCNTCPWVKKWEDRYNPIAMMAKDHGIGMVAVNSNEAYREKGDGYSDMQERAEEMGYEFFYALDRDHKLADAFGANRTPEIFLFNKEMELVYHGAIDDNANSAAEVEQNYLMSAINELAKGEEIDTQTTKSLGCTIKRTD